MSGTGITFRRTTEARLESMSNYPSTMETNFFRQSNIQQGIVENHPFYHCIRPLLLLQKISGGWIHRPLVTPNDNYQYYAFKIYCVSLGLITIGALIRTAFIFDNDVSMNTENMLIFMQGSVYVTACISQIASYFKYRKILSFWDNIVHIYPEKFNIQHGRPTGIMWAIIIMTLCILSGIVSHEFYFILKPNPDPAYIRLSEPWTGSVTEARVAYMITTLCLLPAYITWMSACLLFMVAVYYLRWGFRNLHQLMTESTQLVNQLASHKRQHMHLSQMTEELDDILWGHIGASMTTCTFDLCLLIFTLHGSHRMADIMGSITLLIMALSTMSIIAVLSISVNTWVCTAHCGRCLVLPNKKITHTHARTQIIRHNKRDSQMRAPQVACREPAGVQNRPPIVLHIF